MSVHATRWAWEQSVGHPTRKLVLVALADHANSDGECWPSMGTVATFAECSARTVQRHIDALCEQGLVKKVGRRARKDGTFGPWNYQLPMSSGHERPADTDDRRPPKDRPADTGDDVQRTHVSSQNHQGNHQEPPGRPSPETTKELIDLLASHVERHTGRKPRSTPQSTWELEAVNLMTVDAAPVEEIKRVIRFLPGTWWAAKVANFRDLRNFYVKVVMAMNEGDGGRPPPSRQEPCEVCGNLSRRDGELTCGHERGAA